MDYPKRHPSLFFITLFAISLLFEISNGLGGVMRVQRKFMGNHRHLADLEKHDAHRHAQIIDVPIGGSTDMRIGLYFTDLAIGTPPKNYTVHVDTGSSNLWINCQDCISCPMDDDTQGIHLRPYNPSTSKTAMIVTRGHDYCKKRAPDSKDDRCPFDVHYLDGTNISGYYVRDLLTYTKVSGGRKSQSAQAKVTFGCVTHYDGQRALGNKYMSLSVEGLLGLGSSNVSIISQLASSGIVRKEFAHCLVPGEGGGIFAIGHVVKPEVKMIPLHPQTGSLYAASMKSVEVNGKFADLEATAVDNFTIIDSGASLILLPEALFNFVIKEMFSNKSNLNVYGINDFTCFNHSGSLDMTGFPTISFHFFDRDTSKVHPVPLRVSPHDYLLQADDHIWCVAIRNGVSGQTILGDTALSNKLVVYDVENKEIGWTEYDCSSSIELEDGNGEVCAVGAHSESPLF